jgi:predicted glutamine amidotransferase
MCRFVTYQGHKVLIADLLYRPRHSLVQQSHHSELLSQTFNADGFGVGFYLEGDDPTPCVMRSTAPAWSNRNLESLSRRLESPRLFAHIRAASPGFPVQETNCHPFHHGRFMFMHNGAIGEFLKIKRRLQTMLSDAAWATIEGTTDSEHAFALFLDEVSGGSAEPTTGELRKALLSTIDKLVRLTHEAGVSEMMACNFAVTDGRSMVVSRFVHGTTREPASLYYSAGRMYECVGEDGDMVDPFSDQTGVVMVASEPLTRRASDWNPIPANHTISIRPDCSYEIEPMEIGT